VLSYGSLAVRFLPSSGEEDGGEECSVAPLWMALLSVQSSELLLENSIGY
jgi:hypothetical protein